MVKPKNTPQQAPHDLWWERLQAFGKFVHRLDHTIFRRINGLPHPAWVNYSMRFLARVMVRGDAVVMGLLLRAVYERVRGSGDKAQAALWRVAPVLWLTTAIAEFLLKSCFRRPRPFLRLGNEVLVGRAPARHSFPSGHTVSAFAAAWMVSKEHPRRRIAYYSLACLVGFCRIYLGVHYPSDVAAGALSGVGMAEIFQRLLIAQRILPPANQQGKPRNIADLA
jgi:undecaprenyl-diphosphatase